MDAALRMATDDSDMATAKVDYNPHWPAGFERVPDEHWVTGPVDELTLKYECAGGNGFNRNWDPTLSQALAVLDETKILVDYSSGTGLFAERLLRNVNFATRIINADISPKFLRVSIDKFRDDYRVALRLMKRLDEGKKFQSIDEVLGVTLLGRGIDVLTSTNAIHLYPNLLETVESWHRVLRANGLLLINSGDIANPERTGNDWRLHDAVVHLNEIAQELVRTEPAFERYREAVEDSELMAAYTKWMKEVYPPSKPVDIYLDSLSDVGFRTLHYFEHTIEITVNELSDAIFPYHDVVLGWIGGCQKIEGYPPSRAALRDRLFLIKYSIERLYGKDSYLRCPWVYITCKR